MAVTVTIDRVTYTITKLDNGNLSITGRGGQRAPMHGPDTEGIFAFEVHPCQVNSYEFWQQHLPAEERTEGGEGRWGSKPWWSSKSWKRKGVSAET